MSNENSINSTAPEQRRIAPGDIVQIKGGVGPKLTVIGEHRERAGHVECVYWDTSRDDCDRFESIFVHCDSLAIFDTPGPGGTRPTVTVSRSVIGQLTSNALVVLRRSGGNPDVDVVRDCIVTLQDELAQHVDISVVKA